MSSFGCRGEALNSLCALASVSVLTRTATQAVGARLVFDTRGAITEQQPAAREVKSVCTPFLLSLVCCVGFCCSLFVCGKQKVGTTVCVTRLFERLPVRAREFKKNIKREFGKLVALLQQYACICHDVRLTCTNVAGASKRHRFSEFVLLCLCLGITSCASVGPRFCPQAAAAACGAQSSRRSAPKQHSHSVTLV